MLDFLNSARFETAKFITLTYRYNMQNCKDAYADLHNWYKLMSKYGGGCALVWKREFQERGAVHFHIFALDAGEGWTHEEMVARWLFVTNQTGDEAARHYGVDDKSFDLLHNRDAGVIVAYMAKYAAKDTHAGTGKAWGIFGRRFSDTQKARYALYDADASEAGKKFIRAGAVPINIDGGGVVYRLYFSCMGVGPDAKRRDFLLDFITEIGGMVIE